jgi:hypothetical protein
MVSNPMDTNPNGFQSPGFPLPMVFPGSWFFPGPWFSLAMVFPCPWFSQTHGFSLAHGFPLPMVLSWPMVLTMGWKSVWFNGFNHFPNVIQPTPSHSLGIQSNRHVRFSCHCRRFACLYW